MMLEMRSSGEATISELKKTLEDLRSQRREVSPLPPMPFADVETGQMARRSGFGCAISCLGVEPLHSWRTGELRSRSRSSR